MKKIKKILLSSVMIPYGARNSDAEARYYDISGHVGFSCITFVNPK